MAAREENPGIDSLPIGIIQSSSGANLIRINSQADQEIGAPGKAFAPHERRHSVLFGVFERPLSGLFRVISPQSGLFEPAFFIPDSTPALCFIQHRTG